MSNTSCSFGPMSVSPARAASVSVFKFKLGGVRRTFRADLVEERADGRATLDRRLCEEGAGRSGRRSACPHAKSVAPVVEEVHVSALGIVPLRELSDTGKGVARLVPEAALPLAQLQRQWSA